MRAENSLEFRLLLNWIQSSRHRSIGEKVEAILGSRALDWERLAKIARKQGITTLVYYSLRQTSNRFISSEIVDRLHHAAQNIATCNLLHLQELLRLLTLLESQDIAVIPIKGATLAAIVYGDLAVRQFSDLDLLVRRADFLKAKEILEKEGYSPVTPPVCLRASQEKADIPRNGECTLFHPERQIYLDLHWRLLAGMQFALPKIAEERWDCWQRRQPIALAGKTVNTLGWEDLLLYLCFHGAKDLWWQLKWIADIAELVSVAPIDWECLMERSRSLGCHRMVLLGLFLAGNLLGATYPLEIEAAIESDRLLIFFANQVDRWMGQERDPWEQNVSWLAVFRWQFLLLDRWSDRWRYCWAYLQSFVRPTVTDLKFISLPQRLYFLYFFIRPLRIVGKLVVRSEGSR
ncbi:MAG: nucleotidyltransferase family protein [Cyanosarcina radialis HA8281-LM2]|jgi:hypothetical protein|nr:nucleotidyltransferase family protein [Cyanosarcina radialis HA8281-LM2]